jgi:hypothetical protein
MNYKTIIATQRADLAMELFLQVRNKWFKPTGSHADAGLSLIHSMNQIRKLLSSLTLRQQISSASRHRRWRGTVAPVEMEP